MSRKTQQRIGRIHRLINPVKPTLKPSILVSANNSPDANQLREFLFAIHRDVQIAGAIGKKYQLLYDPEPTNEGNYYLAWKAEKNQVQYARIKSGMMTSSRIFPDEKPVLYRCVNGRFYAPLPGFELVETELIGHFPNLTVSKLEKCVEGQIRELQKS